jgi:hypothetical protein
MNTDRKEAGKVLPPFYATLEKIAAALERDVCFRQAWREFAAGHPEDRAGELVAVLLPLERRSRPLRADPRWRWRW